MPRFSWLNKSKLSYKEESTKVRQSMDPLDFLAAESGSISTRDAFQQIHAVLHGALEDVEKAIQLVFEQLGPEVAVADRIILEANGESYRLRESKKRTKRNQPRKKEGQE